MNLRAAAKGAVERALVTMGAARWSRRRNRRNGVILAYHNVLPDREPPVGDRSLHLPFRIFRDQMELLSRTHHVVALPTLLEAVEGGGGHEQDRPMAAITFDDAYRGAIQIALPWLHSRSLPATVFVAPRLLGDRSTWWDRLADPDTGVMPDDIRNGALIEARGQEEAVLTDWSVRIQEMPPHARSATTEELLAAVATGGVGLAAHSWSHPNLARLTTAEVTREIEETEAWFRTHLGEGNSGEGSSLLAYPYGLCSPKLHRWLLARGIVGLGLQGGMVTPGILRHPAEPIPRINIPAGVSLRGFELRISGVWGGP